MVLMFLQMTGTFMPLCFKVLELKSMLPTLEGQYIIKNIIIITAALIIGRSYLKPN